MAKQSESLPRLKTPSLDQVCDLFESILQDADLFKEPMYELSKENIKKLKSALEIPSASFLGEEKYHTLEEKAAALFYLVIKNHAFPNGNKRTAVILTLLFLKTNNHWLDLSQDELYNLAIDVASKTNKNHDKNVTKIRDIFIAHIK